MSNNDLLDFSAFAVGADTPAVPDFSQDAVTPAVTSGASLSPIPMQYMDAIKDMEGFSGRSKWDYKQHTNGFGTKAKYPGEVIDESEANKRFVDEMGKAAKAVDDFAPGLPDGIRASLASLTFNSGADWQRMGLGAAIKTGDFEDAGKRFNQYVNAGGKPLQGLIDRRTKEYQWWFDHVNDGAVSETETNVADLKTTTPEQMRDKLLDAVERATGKDMSGYRHKDEPQDFSGDAVGLDFSSMAIDPGKAGSSKSNNPDLPDSAKGAFGDLWGILKPEERRPAGEDELKSAQSAAATAKAVRDRLDPSLKRIASEPQSALDWALKYNPVGWVSDKGVQLADYLAEAYQGTQDKRVTSAEDALAGKSPLPTKTASRSAAEGTLKSAAKIVPWAIEHFGQMRGYGTQLGEKLSGRGVTSKVEDDAAYKFGKGLDDWLEKQLPGDQARQQQFVQQAAQGIGSTVGFWGPGAVAKLLGAGEKGYMAAIALAGIQAQSADKFNEITKLINDGKATEQDRLINWLAGIPLGASEALPFAPTIGGPLKTVLGGRVASGFEQAIEEALQEGGQGVGENLAARKTYDPKRNLLEGVPEGMAIGGITGGLFGAALGKSEGMQAAGQDAPQPVPPPIPGQTPPPAPAPQPTAAAPEQPDTVAPPPVPAADRTAARVSPDDLAILKDQGWDDSAIAEMGDEELAQTVIDARDQTAPPKTTAEPVAVPDTPSAEPVSDLTAQIEAMRAGERKGVYLSPDNLANLRSNPDFVTAISKAIHAANGEMIANVDGKGGVLVAANPEIAKSVKTALQKGTDTQSVIGEVTGAGTGKPAGGSAVVQQRTKDGAVTRESLVTPDQVAATEQAFASPGKTVETVSPGEAIARRNEMIGAEQGTAPQGDGTRAAPVQVTSAEDVARAGAKVAEPTPAQAENGNYQHGHLKIHGFDISIETPKGGIRRGPGWEVVSPAAYGYFKNVPARANDKEHVDVYVGDDVATRRAFIVDQYDLKTGRFDEPKVLLGVRSRAEAEALYDAGFSDGNGPKRRRGVSSVSVDDLKVWLQSGDATRPYAATLPRSVEGSRVQDLAERGGPDTQSKQSLLPQLRGQGNQDVPGMGGQFRGVPDGRRDQARYEDDVGSDRQREGVRARQRTLGDQEGAGAQYAEEPPSDAQWSDADIDGVGRGNRASAVNSSVSTEAGRYERGASTNDAAADGQAAEVDAIDFSGQAETPDGGPAEEPLTAQDIETIVKAWRYVKAIDEQVQAGRSVPDAKLDKANELDADLADYGVTIEDYPDEDSLRQYLGGGGESVAEEPAGTEDQQSAAQDKAIEDPVKAFDPYAFSVQVVLAKEGQKALKERLSGLEADELQQIIDTQHLAVSEAILERGDLGEITTAMVQAAKKRLQDRGAAAGDGQASLVPEATTKEKITAESNAKEKRGGNEVMDVGMFGSDKDQTDLVDMAKQHRPAVPVKKSVMPDYIISLEDGSKHADLRPHLESLGITPQEYAEKWGLPDDYPLVAPEVQVKSADKARSAGEEYEDVTVASDEAPTDLQDDVVMAKAETMESGQKTGSQPPAQNRQSIEIAAGTGAAEAAKKPAGTPLDALRDRLLGDGFKTIIEARKFAKEQGIDGSNKDIDEAIENAVVAAARLTIDKGGKTGDIYQALVDLYGKQPNLAVRTSTSVSDQAYSTPMPLAYLASRLAGVQSADLVYEPTAGNGALLIEANPANVVANEINPDRAAALRQQGFATVKSIDATSADVTRAKSADSVIMNPPFGAVREDGQSKTWTIDDFTTTSIDHAIALNGLKAMRDDGKAVLILGGIKAESLEERRAGYRGQGKRKFFAKLYKAYNVTDHFTVSGDLYKKQGAGWPVDVVVIEGRGQSQRLLPAAEPPAIFNSWDELEGKLPNGTVASDADQTAVRHRRQNDGPDQGERGSESGNAGGVTADVRGGAERLHAEGQDKSGGIRGDSDRGKPADVRPDRDHGRDHQSQPDGLGGRVDVRPAPRREPVERPERKAPPKGSGQALYRPSSNATSLDTLVPVNMADATKSALDRVAKKHGDLDTFVADRLGYDEDLSKVFSAEQVDALATAIDNVERGAGFIVGDQCVAGQTRIYDPTTGEHTPIKVLAERNRPIKVLTLTPNGFQVASATSPFLKGVADLYRVMLDDGREITVTRQHRFLTPDGWLTLDAGLRAGCFLGSCEGPLPKNSGARPLTRHEDAQHSSGKPQGSTGGCSAYSCRGDEQLHSGPGAGQELLPSPVDVLERIQKNWRVGDCFSSGEHSRLYLSSGHHSRNNSSPAETPGLLQTDSQAVASLEPASRVKRQSVAPSHGGQEWLHPEGDAIPAGQYAVAAFCSSLIENASGVRAFSSDTSPSDTTRHSVCQPQSCAHPQGNPGTSDHSGLSFGEHTGWRRIVSIEFVERAEFFDMWVPGFENYVAEGLVNHNTGVGKGRFVAGMIRYAIRKGWTPVFVTEKPDLYGDMFRDMTDIGLPKMLGREPNAFMTNTGESVPLDDEALTWKQEADQARSDGQPIPSRRGRFLRAGGKAAQDSAMQAIVSGKAQHDIVFTTYDQMNTIKQGETDRRNFLRQIAPNSLLILDESHNAGGQGEKLFKKKGLAPDRAEFVRDLVKTAAGVVYSSATFAKRPDVMDLYARTDMGKAVDDPKMLPALIQRGGVPMQQIVATMLSDAGQYMRRERSFEGVDYAVEPVEVNDETYRQFSDAVRSVFEFDMQIAETRDEFMTDILDRMGAGKAKDSGIGEASAHSTAFASIMHNIVNQMLLSIKADKVADRAITATKAGEKPVIALASTMESFIRDFATDVGINTGSTIDISFGDVLRKYLERTLRITVKDENNTKKHVQIPVDQLPSSLQHKYREALGIINDGSYASMPVSPIDWIRHRLTKAGLSVAEVTGRQTMVDYTGKVPKYTERPKSEMGPSGKRSSIAAFNRGALDAIILNRSGSTGVSMHAGAKFKDQRPRRMIIAQAEANIDTHLQMLGRVHRTGQVVTPGYSQIAASIPAEARPTAVLMKKMASLNANTTGARSSVFMADAIDFMNEYGDRVVANIIADDSDLNFRLGSPLKENDKGLPTSEDAARRVTGRLVLLSPKDQTELLNRIQDEYKAEIERLDALGENALEAKTIDLKAKVLDTTPLKDKTGEGPFKDSAQIEKVSVKAQGRAMSPAEVVEAVSKFLRVTSTEGSEQASLGQLEANGRAWTTQKVEEVSRRAREWIAEDVAAKSDDARVSVRARHQEGLERWTATARLAAPGARVTLKLNDRQMHGIVLSLERTGKAKNPVALGAWRVKVAVPDSARTIDLPMSKLYPPNTTKSDDEPGIEIVPSQVPFSGLISQLEDARREGREERYMVTGNILAGYDQVHGKGQIVNFTMDDGSLRPGILMSRDFLLDKFMTTRTVRLRSGDQVAEFLDKAPMGEVRTSDKFVTLSFNRGTWTIETPAGRGTGGRYYTDSRVRDALRGKEFQKYGGVMRAELDRAGFVRVTEAIRSVGGLFETTDNQDLAQDIVRKSSPTDEAAKPTSNVSAAIGASPVSFDAVEDAALAGKTYVLPRAHVAQQIEAIRPLLGLVPANTHVGVLEKVSPVDDGGLDPLNKKVILHFSTPDGRSLTMNFSLRRLEGTRAFAVPASALGGRSGLFLLNVGTFKNLGPAAAGEIWHEAIHILRREGKISGHVWGRLLAHANKLRIFDMKMADFLRAVGDLEPAPDVTLRQAYARLYQNRADKVEVMRQESITHMLELWHHGVISDADMAPVRDILEDIRSGKVSGNSSRAVRGAEPAFAASRSQPDQDSLGYYSGALRAAYNLRQERGTPEQMLAMLKNNGVKQAEIEATGLDKFLSEKFGSSAGTGEAKSGEVTETLGLEPRPMEQVKLHDIAQANLDTPYAIDPVQTVPLSSLHGSHFDAGKVAPLAAKIKSNGWIEPLVVDRLGNVVEGQHRLRALQKLGIKSVPVHRIREILPDDAARAIQAAAKDTGVHREQAASITQQIANIIDKEGVGELGQYDAPKGFEKAWSAAVAEAQRRIAPSKGDRSGGKAGANGRLNQISRDEIIKYLEEKRVEVKGQPLFALNRLYHSTPAKFDRFSNEYTDEVGFHFGTKDQAHNRAYIQSNGNLWTYFRKWRDIPVEIDVNNPVTLSTDPGSFMPMALAKQLVKDNLAPYELIAQVQDKQLGPDGSPEEAKAVVRDYLVSKGYDAIRYPNHYEGTGDYSYMTFGTGNVKDARTGDVLYAISGNVNDQFKVWMEWANALPETATAIGSIQDKAGKSYTFDRRALNGSITYRVLSGRKEVGSFYVRTGGSVPLSASVMNARVDKTYQRRGIASAAYDAIESDIAPTGWKLYPQGSFSLSSDGRAFWQARDPAKLAEMVDADRAYGFNLAGNVIKPAIDAKAKSDLVESITNAIEIVQRIAGQGLKVEFHSDIPASYVLDRTPYQADEARNRGLTNDSAGGFYRPGSLSAEALIGLSTNAPGFDLATTAGHEAWHHVETALATAAERSLLAAPSELERMRRLAASELGLEADDSILTAMPDYEVRAYAFQRYRRLREDGVGPLSGLHIGLRRFFDRLIRVFHNVSNAVRGLGYDSFESIFERARTGGMVQRQAEPKPDTTPPPIPDKIIALIHAALAKTSNDNPDFSAEMAAHVSAFMSQRLGQSDGDSVAIDDLEGAYAMWAEDAGVEPLDAAVLSREMMKAGVSTMRIAGANRFIGLRLLDENEQRPANPTEAREKDAFDLARDAAIGFSMKQAVSRQIERLKSVIGEKPDFARIANLEALQQVIANDDSLEQDIYDNVLSMMDDPVLGNVIPRTIEPGRRSGGVLGRNIRRTLARASDRSDAARVLLQDKALPIRRIAVERIENETGAKVPLNLDTYVAEGLFHGRAGERMADLQDKRIEPFIEHLRRSGLTVEEVGEYLYARHALERNAAIGAIDPTNLAGSGMTDAEAIEILNRARQSGKQAQMDQAAAMVDQIITEARDTLLRSGLIDRETYDAWSMKYQNYVPLRGFELGEEENPDRIRSGRGFDIKGPESRRALGRRSKADNPVMYAILQAEQAIVRAEKNRVNKTLYRMIQANPNPAVWAMYRGESKRRVNPTTGMIETYWVLPPFVRNDAVHGVKINGKQFWMELKHPSLARAMRGVGSEIQGTIVGRAMMSLTRTYAQLLTSWNPEFMVSNFFRDVETALLNVSDLAGKSVGARRQIIKDALSLTAIRGAYNALRGDGTSEYARWFDEFRLAGGKISFMEYNDVARIKKSINASLKAGNMRRALRAVSGYVEDINTSVENGVRLSAYIALRKAGIEKDRAAFTARELTVNFNRKGELGPAINSMYLFFNASIQGTTRVAQAFVRSRAVKYAVAGIFSAGLALDFANMLMAGDDDDGENRYDKIPEWVRDRNIIIMNPFGTGDYITIPMAYGYNLPYLAGQEVMRMARGKSSPLGGAARITSSALDAFNPLGSSNDFWQMVSPTMLDPGVQVLENKTWYGGPIQPTKFDAKKPSSENYFTSAPWWAVDTAKILNAYSGGNEGRSGYVDISPEVIEHYVEFAGGGVAKFVANAINSGERVVHGEEWLPEKTPFVRRLYGKTTTQTRTREFYEVWDDVDRAHYEVKTLSDKHDRAGAEEARQKYAPELRVYAAMKGAKKALKNLRAQRDKIKADSTLDRETLQTRIGDIDRREKELISRVLKQYHEAQKRNDAPPTTTEHAADDEGEN